MQGRMILPTPHPLNYMGTNSLSSISPTLSTQKKSSGPDPSLCVITYCSHITIILKFGTHKPFLFVFNVFIPTNYFKRPKR
nr:MAG TPA: hypothetical protein [Bacteriophage sp.]